jgi:hypothetical protein
LIYCSPEDDGGDNFDRDESVDLDMDKKSDEDDERKKLLKPPSDEPIDMDVYGAASEMGSEAAPLPDILEHTEVADIGENEDDALSAVPGMPDEFDQGKGPFQLVVPKKIVSCIRFKLRCLLAIRKKKLDKTHDKWEWASRY